MGYIIITDSASNLTKDITDKHNIEVISYYYYLNNTAYLCYEEDRPFDETAIDFYTLMRNKEDISTSLINPEKLTDIFKKHLEDGDDILFMGISSGLSGTMQAARIASEDLLETYPDRKCVVVDSIGASLGEGLLVVEAAKMRNNGVSLEDTVEWIENNRLYMNHIFTVGDLYYLKKGGRISAAKALVGNVLNIKPLLYASPEGKIEMYNKARGRQKALDTLVQKVIDEYDGSTINTIGIAHADAPKDAEYIAKIFREKLSVDEVIVRYYDICTGAHVGPDTIAIFFMGKNRA